MIDVENFRRTIISFKIIPELELYNLFGQQKE